MSDDRTRLYNDSDETPDTGENSLERTQLTNPSELAQFSILEVLGRGGFGTVYRASDNLLEREVAIKIPHPKLVNQAELAAVYLHEGRAMASLDHPHIIPVYLADRTDEVSCFLVTKLIRGCHLGQWLRENRPSHSKLATMIRCIALALGYAHSKGIVHRDVKPGNILIDEDDVPYIGDFGLALRDADRRDGPAYAGTPSYMSPEQARGEGHRVDGRSDIFSLGVVFYLALTGRKPFGGGDQSSLFDEIIYAEPTHPQEFEPGIPDEVVRICLRALAKSVHDRYPNCDALVADLDHYLASTGKATGIGFARPSQGDRKIMPKGLRPFDVRDADHYLRLLPGPYDRDGLPEIVRFWLSRIEPRDSGETVSLGLIYGPSGCGKSSLVRAGLIPRVSSSVNTIYLQATPDATESMLIDAIESRHGVDLDPERPQADIVDAMTRLRRRGDSKTVIFIDQFEQWLFNHPEVEREPLTRALRQCDGDHLQCILLVRDDFWLGISRMMQAMDLPIIENENATLLDLFDVQHARNVLALFGAAYGSLPEEDRELSVGQTLFLDSAADYLARDGRVICVQLALLTVMLKNRPWDNTTDLFKDGGTEIGVRFLEETFDSDQTPRRIRQLSDHAERVLRALMPEAGSDIKGAIRSEQELMESVGFRDKSAFRKLLAVLDGELHLITPTDRTDDESLSEDSVSFAGSTGYQLTHDFLIAPIRQWLELRNRTTKAGKARLRLEEFSALYRARPMPQALPALGEYVSIRRRVSPATYTASQQRMMNAAKSLHAKRLGGWIALGVALMLGAALTYRLVNDRMRQRATEAQISRLLDATLDEAIPLAETLRENRDVRRRAKALLADTEAEVDDRVRAALVLPDQEDASRFLVDYALEAPVDDVVAIARQVSPLSNLSETRVTGIWKEQTADASELMRAACLIANDPQRSGLLADYGQLSKLFQLLLLESPVWSESWSSGFEPIAESLVPRLTSLLSDEDRDQPSLTAVNLLRQYSMGDNALMARLVTTALPPEFELLVETLGDEPPRALAALTDQWERTLAAHPRRAKSNQPWGSPWWVLGKREPINLARDESFVSMLTRRLKDVQAVVGGHAIVAHQVPEGSLERTNELVGRYGFRLAAASPTGTVDSRYFVVSWLRDNCESRFRVGLSADELREANRSLRDLGFTPDSVSVYDLDTEAKYVGIWIKIPEGSRVLGGDLYVDVPGARHQVDGWERLGNRGFWLARSNWCVLRNDGEDYFTSVRWKTDGEQSFADKWNRPREEIDRLSRLNPSFPLLVNRFSPAESNRESGQRTSVWWHDLPIESQSIDYLSPQEHRSEADRLMRNGFYPVSLNAIGELSRRKIQSVWWRRLPDAEEATRHARAIRNLALATLQLGDSTRAADALDGEFGEAVRGEMISGFFEFLLPPDWLIDQIRRKETVRRVRSCVMALSLMPPSRLKQIQLDEVTELLGEESEWSADPGLLSAVELLSRNWEAALPSPRPTSDELRSPNGDRMVVIHPPTTVWLGSAANEPGRDGLKEQPTAFTLRHDYAIGTHEVTVEQFQTFRKHFSYAKDYAPTQNCPAIGVTWYEAAAYCRWLSDLEDLDESEMCYPKLEEIGPGMRVDADAALRTGYRLPTEVEWEYACRGGATGNRWFGFDPDLLTDHAWTANNSDFILHPVGRRLPNDYGLFDMLGNAMEWCHAPAADYPSDIQSEPLDDPGKVGFLHSEDEPQTMGIRGGAILFQPTDARAAQRNALNPDRVRVFVGFRVARTIRSAQ